MSSQLSGLARLREHFEGQDPSIHGSKWNELWSQGFSPWDRGSPSPALVDLLAERKDLLPPNKNSGKKKALVPGCGNGYDVLLLSSWGYDAYGLDISEKALENARKTEKENAGQGVYEGKGEKGSVTWVSGDFFKDDFLQKVGGNRKFDFIYDYTFLCALPPSLRPAWSKRVNELLSPEGRLVCLEFPTTKDISTGGPPWALPPNVYKALLRHPGEELPYDDSGNLLESQLGDPSKTGLQQIAHFQPKRTHEFMGYNTPGNISDWIGVWIHPHSSL